QVGICPEDEAQTPIVLVRQGVRIGFLAYADPHPKFAYADEFLAFATRPAHGLKETIRRDLENLAKTTDVVVVSLHWGIEYQVQHDPHQEDLGRFIIDHGADIVAGHHPHVLQAAEWYKHGLIIYSMGNFVFDQYSRPPTRLSRLYRVWVCPEGVTRAEYLPLRIWRDGWQPRPQSQEFIPLHR
ncbi:MAG: CapA family protein, partial [Planctomycetes bacterium]|nr:CapA family protein [Planctomycetota bacterium]